jgi:hypothetical protein
MEKHTCFGENKPVLAKYTYKFGYASKLLLDMDESIFEKFQVLNIWQYTPSLDLCYVHIRCVTISIPLGFQKCRI